MKGNTVIHELHQTTRFLSKVVNERLQKHGIFQSQWMILYCIKKFGPMTQTEIWKYLNVEAPTVTRTLTKLERNGWIVRQKGKDQREKIVDLTDKAKSEITEIETTIDTFESEMLKGLSPEECEQLSNLLAKVGR
ncbi:MarR family winged helix-turn-helix transcriptional regulator [Aquibacillus salsiterrae]|uniref:MarR family transcriptional regulator n=1 Tax=Aquibacillus salsiterrae TaxID=2950439 RepID=A0A9X3WH12_9BACI|nr:MarR family transcriptional regulator [Aquibacillus salsiterrae]MDC3418260.1 MarR family transcriptional regulator [Aquibacillus salsiterrae]